MSIRCKIGLHGEPIYNYDEFKAHCSRCRKDLGPTPALLFLTERTNEWWKKFIREGELKEWEVWFYIEHMWDEGYEEGKWKRLREKSP